MSNNGMQSSVKQAFSDVHLDDVKESLEDAGKAMEKEVGKAGKAVSRAADKVVKTAKANPLVTAGVLVGAGALLGALLHSLLRPQPTAGEVILRALKRGAEEAQDGVRSGIKTARRAMK